MSETLQTESFTWRGLAGEAASCLAPGITQWLEYLGNAGQAPAGAIPVKSNLYRSVWKIETPPTSLPGAGGAIYLKRYRFPRFSDRMKYTFFETRAEVEWKIAHGLAARGIASFTPLLYAERKTAGIPSEALFVSREIVGAQPLDRFLEKLSPAARESLLGKIAEFLASMHGKGVHHRDLHQSNLLGLNPAAPQLALVDLHTARLGGRVSRRERIANLAQLLHSLRPSLLPQERTQILDHYRRVAPHVFPDGPRLAAAIEQRIWRIDRRQARSRDKRCLVRSSVYEVKRGPFAHLYRRREWPATKIEEAIARHRQAPALPGSVVLKKEGRSLVTQIPWEANANSAATRLCVKEIGPGGLGSLIEETLRGSRGRRAWAASHALTRRGIPCPKAFGLYEKMAFGIPHRSHLVTEFLEGTQSLLNFLEKIFVGLTREEKKSFLHALAKLVASLHREGLYHRDLQTRNILVRERAPAGWELFVIDLESVRPRVRLGIKRRLRNLMQLNDCPRTASRADRLRFLRAYEKEMGSKLTKEELQSVLAATKARLDRAARLGAHSLARA